MLEFPKSSNKLTCWDKKGEFCVIFMETGRSNAGLTHCITYEELYTLWSAWILPSGGISHAEENNLKSKMNREKAIIRNLFKNERGI